MASYIISNLAWSITLFCRHESEDLSAAPLHWCGFRIHCPHLNRSSIYSYTRVSLEASTLWDLWVLVRFPKSGSHADVLLWDRLLFLSNPGIRRPIFVNKELPSTRPTPLFLLQLCFYRQLVFKLEVKYYRIPSLLWLWRLSVWLISRLPPITEKCYKVPRSRGVCPSMEQSLSCRSDDTYINALTEKFHFSFVFL